MGFPPGPAGRDEGAVGRRPRPRPPGGSPKQRGVEDSVRGQQRPDRAGHSPVRSHQLSPATATDKRRLEPDSSDVDMLDEPVFLPAGWA